VSNPDRCEPPQVEGRWRVAVLTVSDLGSQGLREDRSGDFLASRIRELPGEVVLRHLLPDEPVEIEGWLRQVVLEKAPALILCTGGTGLHPRDRTPEAVLRAGEYQVPGMAEAMRREGARHTPHAMLSRQVAVVLGPTLILALPGALKAAQESLEAVWPALPHALEMVAGLPSASTDLGHRGGTGAPG
jgi:molybdenum cofactor synthesis domain-containing protein